MNIDTVNEFLYVADPTYIEIRITQYDAIFILQLNMNAFHSVYMHAITSYASPALSSKSWLRFQSVKY